MKTKLREPEELLASWRTTRYLANGPSVSGKLFLTNFRLIFEPSGYGITAAFYGWKTSLLNTSDLNHNGKMLKIPGEETLGLFKFSTEAKVEELCSSIASYIKSN